MPTFIAVAGQGRETRHRPDRDAHAATADHRAGLLSHDIHEV
jgi:hypothetical protein